MKMETYEAGIPNRFINAEKQHFLRTAKIKIHGTSEKLVRIKIQTQSDEKGRNPTRLSKSFVGHFASTLLPLTLLSVLLSAEAQDVNVDQVPSKVIDQSSYAVASRDGNQKIWTKTTWESNAFTGEITAKTNSYIELSTGSSYLLNGQWIDSSDQIRITRTGAQATNSQHKIEFLGNINSAGAIRLTLPERDKQLVSTPIGISYFDTASGNSVMIAELKDSVGELLLSGNQVLYSDAFTDFSADLLYINSISSFEQLVVFRQQPLSPEEWGLDPQTTVLQLITEFFNPPVPQIAERIIEGMPDQYLSFGVTHMPKGYAFALGDSGMTIPVTKQWLTLDGRQCLIESAPFNSLAPLLEELPPPEQAARPKSPDSAVYKVANKHLLPSRKYVKKENIPLQLANMTPSSKGVVIDYTTLTTQTNLILQGATTYYVNGNVNISGTLTIEGNTVVKFTNTSPVSIIASNVVWATSTYRPAIFTSKNNDAVGELISGSTGNPSTNLCGGVALNMSGGAGGLTISNAHFSFISNVVAGVSGSALTFNNVQFNQCSTVLSPSDRACYFRNCLLYNIGTLQFINCGGGCSGADVHMENVTIHNCTNFSSSLTSAGGTVALTNSLLVNVTNLSGPGATIYTNSSYVINGDSGIFQTVGAAGHFLATNIYRDVGTTNIDSSLLAELRLRTTYPPTVYSNMTTTVNMAFSPQVQRDIDTPDIGYHYAPIDYITHLLIATNCALTVNAGTVCASYNGAGIWPQEGSSITATGTPTAPIWFIRYQSVQELATALGGSPPSSGFGVNPYHTGTPAPNGSFRFTRFSCPANGGNHFYKQNWSYGTLILQDSEVWGGANDLSGWTNTTAILQNNLLNRGTLLATSTTTSNSLSLSNNLILNITSILLFPANSNLWFVYNNIFDSSSPNGTIAPSGNNAYYNVTRQLAPTNASDITLASAIIYKSGPLGDFYRTNSGALIDSGSCKANVNGLYHYTVATNLVGGLQVKEANSDVDIGYHYVAVNSSGQPIDTDSDGAPDYFEDANGNGVVNSGETDWNSASDLGLRVLITRPKNNSLIP